MAESKTQNISGLSVRQELALRELSRGKGVARAARGGIWVVVSVTGGGDGGGVRFLGSRLDSQITPHSRRIAISDGSGVCQSQATLIHRPFSTVL
jgi:hypothetical protein